jgi:hypothetical protein
MIQIILHAIGDYITQNNWMAQNKTQNTLKGYVACFLHAMLYSLPFLLIGSVTAWGLIFITHFLMDKYRLAVYWIKLVNWNWDSTNFGYEDKTPVWMSVWLMIIVDNVIHITGNYLILMFF